MAFPWGIASAEPSREDIAKTCLSLVQAQDYQNALTPCREAYDPAGGARLNGTLATAADVALELRNAQVVEAQAVSLSALDDGPGARFCYRLARIDATFVVSSSVADPTSKTLAAQILDRNSNTQSDGGISEVVGYPLRLPASAPGCEDYVRVTTTQEADYRRCKKAEARSGCRSCSSAN